ncbi:MAG: hypothetical protein ACI9VR_000080 [Cognaticolwellia sp.]
MSPAWKRRLPKAARGAVDALAVVLVLWLRWLAWPVGQSDPVTPGLQDIPASAWQWGGPGDFVLYGPDAGNWAANAEAWAQNAPLDPNRLPVYTALAAVFAPGGDVVWGGHLVNHGAGALACVALYWLGVQTSGRGAALGAALWMAVLPNLVESQGLYGVDPVFGAVFLAAVASAWWATKGHALRAIAPGLLMGLLVGTHYLGLAFPVVLAIGMLQAKGDWKRRVLPAVGALLLGFVVLKFLLLPYESMGLAQILAVYQEGVANPTASAAVAEPLSQRLLSAPMLAVQRGVAPLRDSGLPWWSLVVLLWAGVVGWGLPGRDKRPWDWRSGLWLLVLCGPLILLEATRAPERYRDFLRPLVILLVMRGLASPAAALEAGLRKKLPKWPCGVLPLALCGGVAWLTLQGFVTEWPPRMPIEQALQNRATGLAVADLAVGEPGIRSVVNTQQVVAFYTGVDSCPGNYCSPDPANLASCKTLVLSQCAGDPIAVVVELQNGGPWDQSPNRVFDAWVQENHSPVQRVNGIEAGRESAIYLLSRAEIAAAP